MTVKQELDATRGKGPETISFKSTFKTNEGCERVSGQSPNKCMLYFVAKNYEGSADISEVEDLKFTFFRSGWMHEWDLSSVGKDFVQNFSWQSQGYQDSNWEIYESRKSSRNAVLLSVDTESGWSCPGYWYRGSSHSVAETDFDAPLLPGSIDGTTQYADKNFPLDEYKDKCKCTKPGSTGCVWPDKKPEPMQPAPFNIKIRPNEQFKDWKISAVVAYKNSDCSGDSISDDFDGGKSYEDKIQNSYARVNECDDTVLAGNEESRKNPCMVECGKGNAICGKDGHWQDAAFLTFSVHPDTKCIKIEQVEDRDSKDKKRGFGKKKETWREGSHDKIWVEASMPKHRVDAKINRQVFKRGCNEPAALQFPIYKRGWDDHEDGEIKICFETYKPPTIVKKVTTKVKAAAKKVATGVKKAAKKATNAVKGSGRRRGGNGRRRKFFLL